MPYWAKLLEFKEYRSCQFLLLQLIYQSISVKPKVGDLNIPLLNIESFVESGGLALIFSCLKQIF